MAWQRFWGLEGLWTWIGVHMTNTMNPNSPHLSPSPSLTVKLCVKTMVGCQKWWRVGVWSAFMACHCAFPFSPSPQRDCFSMTHTSLKPSRASKPVVLSSIGSTKASYNALVFEVCCFSLCVWILAFWLEKLMIESNLEAGLF